MKELSRDAQAMLDLARRHDRPRAGDRERVAAGLSGLGAGIASVAAGTSATAATGTAAIGTAGVAQAGGAATGLSALGAKVLGPGLIGLAIGGAVTAPLLFREPERPAPAMTPNQPLPAKATTANARAMAPPVTAQAPSTTDTSRAVPSGSSVVPSVAERSALPPSSARSKRPETLQAEAELLAAASGALGSGRAQRALELLDQHEREYAGGVLAEERAAARVLALCETGRTAEARGHAEQFLQRAPRSPLVPRVRASCAFAPSKAAADPATETSGSGHTAGEPKR